MKTRSLAAMGTIALISLTLGGCGSAARDLAYAKVQIKEQERALADLEAQLAAKQAELDACRGAQHQAPPTPDAPAVPSGGIWSGKDHQDVIATLSNEILFKPGSAVLSSQAKKLLDEVVAKIKSQYADHDVLVKGHTDNQMIKRSKDQWNDNWDLSGGRSQAVLHYLLDHGISAKHLGFAGYGMERPLQPNTSPTNQNKNRRVEIVILSSAN